jgi:valyl-tRNA synthetase
MWRLKQTAIALDQFLNTFIGSGWADETLSAYYFRRRHMLRPAVDILFFWQKNHCEKSYLNEKERLQLPPEYRVVKEVI